MIPPGTKMPSGHVRMLAMRFEPASWVGGRGAWVVVSEATSEGSGSMVIVLACGGWEGYWFDSPDACDEYAAGDAVRYIRGQCNEEYQFTGFTEEVLVPRLVAVSATGEEFAEYLRHELERVPT